MPAWQYAQRDRRPVPAQGLSETLGLFGMIITPVQNDGFCSDTIGVVQRRPFGKRSVMVPSLTPYVIADRLIGDQRIKGREVIDPRNQNDPPQIRQARRDHGGDFCPAAGAVENQAVWIDLR